MNMTFAKNGRHRTIRIVVFLVSLLIVLFMNINILINNTPKQFYASQELTYVENNNSFFENWIVLTTIQYPTDAVKVLAAQSNWRVVVVADKKTPTDWNWTNCHFLSIEKQELLSFSVSRLIPFNSYTRKMFGYLYAIRNGAKWIYDTDDDNNPIDSGMLTFDTMESFTTGISFGAEKHASNSARNLYNPYAFWGQPSIWPRGYPLEDVRKENNDKLYKSCKRQKVPAIQQGLVTKDPDVDALYRLLHADEKTGLDVNFSKHAPPIILNSGTFCPYNSQNTLFHYDAFWSLFLPISVAFRVTDIWRGYFAQKLLHLTGNRLGFYPANAIQKRNAHSYLADFKDETQLYEDAGRVVDFISKWNCQFNLFQDCIHKLSSDFYENKFWTEVDVELVKTWLIDLNNVHYIFPTILVQSTDNQSKISQSESCRNVDLHFSPNSNNTVSQIQKTHGEFKDYCNSVLPANDTLSYIFDKDKDFEKGVWRNLSRIALIVTGNYPFGPSLSILQRLYQHFFAILIFCGPIIQEKIVKANGFLPIIDYNYINVTEEEIEVGMRAYFCTAKAIELRLQNIDGYMVISDDAMYNFWNDFEFNRFRLHASEWPKEDGVMWIVNRPKMENAISIIHTRTKSNPTSSLSKAFETYSKSVGGDGFATFRVEMFSVSDFYYLPKENETVFYELAEVFFEAHLFLEIAVPKIAAGLQWLRFHNSSSER